LIEPIAAQAAIEKVAELYRNEKHSEPLVTAFFNWVYEQRQLTDLTPTNSLTKALNYVNERQVEMKVFLANPHVAMDTNHLERALRVIPMGPRIIYFVGVN
jgi:transposase